MTAPIVTPCHGAPLLIMTQFEGPAYLQREVPSEILCTAEGCYNSWSVQGVAEPFNKPGTNASPSVPVTKGEQQT